MQLPFISALLVLDADGSRVAVKYWDTAAVLGAASTGKTQAEELKTQMAFEKKVFSKTVRNPARQEGYDTIRQQNNTTSADTDSAQRSQCKSHQNCALARSRACAALSLHRTRYLHPGADSAADVR